MATAGICWDLAKAALRAQMEYRANFLVGILAGVVWQVTGFFTIWVILSRFHSIGGWTLGEIAFLYGLRLTAHGLWVVPFARLIDMDYMVREGEFDRFLIRPLNPMLQIITSRLRIAALGDLVGGVVLLSAASAKAGVDWSPVALVYLILVLIGGALAEAALQIGCAALSFRFLDTGGLRFLIDDAFNKFGGYPLKIFSGGMQFFLTWIVPMAFVAYLPAAVLLGRTGELRVSPVVAYLAPLVGLIWFVAAWRIWSWQSRNYQSSGH
jgi:ABC-2 type transport system permease protein